MQRSVLNRYCGINSLPLGLAINGIIGQHTRKLRVQNFPGCIIVDPSTSTEGKNIDIGHVLREDSQQTNVQKKWQSRAGGHSQYYKSEREILPSPL